MNYQEKIDQYLETVNNGLMFFTRKDKGLVGEAMRYSLIGGGKRVRPTLALMTCESLCGDWQPALLPSLAIEMVHSYSLIHDDLPCMDNDDYRRGQLSCHKKYGETVALLAGDALQAKAYELLASIPDAAIGLHCVKILSEASGISGMVYGQELDLSESKDLHSLQLINRNKTGKMITAAVLLGEAAAANQDPTIKTSLKQYADNIGEVFQIVDDFLDVTSTNEVLGKPVGSDIKNNKETYVSLFGLEKAKDYANELTQSACDQLSSLKDKAAPLKWYANQLLVRIK